jgi:Trk K+ transport system NAD-binding subunit
LASCGGIADRKQHETKPHITQIVTDNLLGMPRVVARVNNPKNAWLLTKDWGVDTAVSAPAILTRLLDAAVGVQDVVALLQSERGGVALATEPALRQSLGGHPGGSHIPGG